MSRFAFFISLLVFSTKLLAEPLSIVDATKIKIDLKKPITLDYQSRAWNRSPDQVDEAFIIIRDALTKQLVSLEMKETAENSGRFLGQYRLDPNQPVTEATLEVYLPPQKSKPDGRQIQIVAQMINDGILLRKPYFFRLEKNQQRITIFDSKTQALEAYRYFVRTGQSSQLINPNLLENKARSENEAPLLSKTAESSQINAILDQEELLQKEMSRRAEQLRLLSEKQKKEQEAESQIAAEQGLKLYAEEKYEEALKQFERAIELNPLNKSFYYQYGVTLFRLNQHEKSVAYLNQAETQNVAEKNLFLGLNYLKLKNSELAYSAFSGAQSDPELGVTAKFYLGVIDYNNEALDSAQKLFEQVLETSKDPKLDQAAENYIEQILNIKKYKELQSRKWTLTGTLGGMYDSNILTVSPNAVPTDLSGFRANYGFNLEYRPVFTPTHEFLGQVSVSDMYSVDSGLQGSATFQNIDPQIIQVVLPYRWKGKLAKKVTQLGVTPMWRSIQMNADGVGQREEILSSVGVTTDLSITQSERLTSLYALDIRSDDAKTATAAEEDQDALYLGLSTTQTYFYDTNDTSKAWLGDFGIALNNAKGRNQKFQSLSLGAGYLRPGYFEALWIAKLGLTYRNFNEHLTGRQDTVLNATVLAQKQLNPTLQASAMFGLNSSQSSFELLNFTQFILMGQLTWQSAF